MLDIVEVLQKWEDVAEVIVLSEITDNDNLGKALVYTVRVTLLHRIAGIRTWVRVYTATIVDVKFCSGGLPDVVSGTRFLMALLVRRAMGSSFLPLCVDFSNTGD
ncbi:unnamed protein product [Onchocerca ochengi]|uniref:Uncharacterized protein n=1 Tax=Onchocerca ochengi TaxID=42157 RepID=A0A182EJY2_ONCOC|nr:unnamed protein product [Onchocerca ochengi]